jgi:two-component system chemotaxis response regulator CheV
MEKTVFETGTNELQMLEFLVGKEVYGINIAKVSEIIKFSSLTPMPSAPDAIEGVFMHRDKLVAVINLHTILNYELPEEYGNGLLIVCDFEQLSVAFHVSMVNSIVSLSWSGIEKPPTIHNQGDSLVTGIAKAGDKMIMILDCEKIVCDLNHGREFDLGNIDDVELPKDGVDYNRTIVVAEDSSFLNRVMLDALKKAGFSNVQTFFNGLDAWDYIRSLKGSSDLKQKCAALITDIEMPQMDGHSLTKFIKDDKELRSIPVYIFSSLIHDNMRMRGDSAGADAQYSRAQLADLLIRLTGDLKESKA